MKNFLLKYYLSIKNFTLKHFLKIILISLLAIIVIIGIYFLTSYFLAKAKSEKLLTRISEIKEFNDNLERLRIKHLKESQEKEILDIIEFDEKIQALIEDYNQQILVVDPDNIKKNKNLDELKSIVQNNINISKIFKEKLEKTDYTPRQMQDYLNLLISYLDNNIRINQLLFDYYNSGDYSIFDLTELENIYKNNINIIIQIKQERIKIYRNNNIEYLMIEY